MLPLRNFLEMTKRERDRRNRESKARRRQLFAAWDAERAKGYGGLGLQPDDIGMYDDINNNTYGGAKR